MTTRFAKRSVYFVKISPSQVFPLVLHLSDRKNYTRDMLAELISVLGKHMQKKLEYNEDGKRYFPSSLTKAHQEITTAISFSTSALRYSYYFQKTFPKQFMLTLDLIQNEGNTTWKGLTVLDETLIVSSKRKIQLATSASPLAISAYFSDDKEMAPKKANSKPKKISL